MEGRLAADDYRSAVRSATALLHEQIDGAFGSFDLADRDGLTRFLAAQAIGMRACQPPIMRFTRQRLGCTMTDYWHILRQDLGILGIAADQLPQLELGHGVAHKDAGPWADAGVFYVVAGSRMGAAVLRDRATALTPHGPANASCGYFAVGEGPAAWRLFRQWLAGEAAADGPAMAGLPVMITAAIAAFQLFAQAATWVAAQPDLPTLTIAASLAIAG